MLDTIRHLRQFKDRNPSATKADIQHYFIVLCNPKQERSVFKCEGFAVRFSEANTTSFSNVVLSLSTLRKYDALPFLICIVRLANLDFRLANTTFLKRISHSSHTLRADNVRGSFLGHDIMENYEGISNSVRNFEELFTLHQNQTWEENLSRLVEASHGIIGRSNRAEITEDAANQLLGAPAFASALITTPEFKNLEVSLLRTVAAKRNEILQAGELDNVNLRGNSIERIITGELNAHRVDDLTFDMGAAGRIIVDLKTKLTSRASAPKGYNIEKVLTLLTQPGNAFFLLLVGVDIPNNMIRARLVSIFDPVILKATRVQFHWSGRGSRGVTQLSGDISQILMEGYKASVDIAGGEALLRKFLRG